MRHLAFGFEGASRILERLMREFVALTRHFPGVCVRPPSPKWPHSSNVRRNRRRSSPGRFTRFPRWLELLLGRPNGMTGHFARLLY